MAEKEYSFEIEFFESLIGRLPKDADVIEILGGLYSKTGRVDDSLKMDRRLVRLKPDNATAHYNLGCSLALKHRKADAVRSLRKAIDLGYRDVEWMRGDPDLQPLHGHPAFQALLEEMEKQSGQGSGS